MPPGPSLRSRAPLTARTAWRGVFGTLFLLLLTSCATTGHEVLPQTPEAMAAEAEAAFARGAYAEAADAWQKAAANAPADRADSLRIRSADAWVQAGEVGKARSTLRGVSKPGLGTDDRARLQLVLADVALRSGRPDEAQALLQNAAGILPGSMRQRYRELQSRATQMLSSPISRELLEARSLVADMTAFEPGKTIGLMRTLETVPSGELAIRAVNPRGDRQMVGWLDLALVIRLNLVVPDGIRPAVAAWKGRHPYHLLNETEALDTWLRYRQLFSPPLRTAVLLPDTAGLKAASEAIRDGLLSAFLDRPGSEILFFFTGADTESTIAAYFSALDAGADQIIGPLRRESVEAVLGLPGQTTPILALNDLPAGFVAPPGLAGQLSGISLSQEREVAAIADQAIARDYRRAMLLAPENSWGERMIAAFEAEFLQGDRQIIAAARYLESENDHSAVLERALRIDESKERARKLGNVLQQPLEFEPVRRHDVDFIFMAANSTHAKQLRPQLRFLDAGDIPVYATGRIYSGEPSPAQNQDLDGVCFPATRWELAHSSMDAIPELASLRNGALGSLFALGQDAWNILSWLELLRKDPEFVFTGLSGDYQMHPDGRLDRQPAWAEFRLGRPVPMVIPPPLPPMLSLQPPIPPMEIEGLRAAAH